MSCICLFNAYTAALWKQVYLTSTMYHTSPFYIYDTVFCVLVPADGEVSVASLSPAHSSVPSPASVEALSPYSLHVSHCLQLGVLLCFQHLTRIYNANFLPFVIGRVCIYICAHFGVQFKKKKKPDGVQNIDSCSLPLDRNTHILYMYVYICTLSHSRHLLTKALNTLSN